MECHHKKPKSLNGTDEYKNLVFISENLHKLIHATEKETIVKYMTLINPTDDMIRKVNDSRVLVGNESI